jgi:hypothetical protein
MTSSYLVGISTATRCQEQVGSPTPPASVLKFCRGLKASR